MSRRIYAIVLIATMLPASAFGQDSLLELSQSGSPEDIREALENGASVSVRDRDEKTPLFIAAGDNGDPEVIRLLLEYGANIDARDEDGRTPLMQAAAENGNPAVTKALLDHGAEIDARDNRLGRTALMLAAGLNSNPDVVRALLDAGAELDLEDHRVERWNALFYAACWNENPAVTRALIELGANPNRRSSNIQHPVLLQAIGRARNLEVIETLLSAGANPNAQSPQGWTILMEAARESTDPELFSLLVSYDANINARHEEFNITPLIVAARFNRNPRVIERMLDLGADPEVEDNRGMRAKDYAEENEELDADALFIDAAPSEQTPPSREAAAPSGTDHSLFTTGSASVNWL